MSDTREKLSKLMVEAYERCWSTMCPTCKEYRTANIRSNCQANLFADYLIANGVRLETKQATKTSEWIPAKEPPKESGEYLVVIHKAAQATTLLYSAEEKSWYEATVSYATNPDGEEVYTYYPVDWWMPLPEPPKGE